jgi:hypothetical protein
VSYDLEIGSHSRPTIAQVEAWATGHGLVVKPESDTALVVEKESGAGDRFVLDLDGPHAAEADDFAEELAAACLAPRWMVGVSVPYSMPKRNIALARSLARHLAEVNDGAAFDPQEDGLLWPRRRRKRVPPRRSEEETTRLALEWFVPPARWPDTPSALVALLKRLCFEALPTRFGQFEPLQHRFDPQNPDEFVRFLIDNEAGDAFWFASRPSFGGSCFAPHADKYAPATDDRFRVAHVEVDFDGNVLAADPRWREAVVDLFVSGARELGAFYAAAQLETGWMVSTNNRLWAVASTAIEHEHFLRGRLWQGLPPVPVWLSWYGVPYRELVAEALAGQPHGIQSPDEKSTGIRRSLKRRRVAPTHPGPHVETRDGGVFVRVGDEPKPATQLPNLPLPAALTYRHRPRTVDERGAVSFNPAQREDQAEVIPNLAN